MAVAVLGAALVAAVTLGAAPMLVASGGSSAIRSGLAELGPSPTVLTATATTSFESRSADLIRQVIVKVVRGLPLGPPAVTALSSRAFAVTRPGSTNAAPVQLASRDGFERHVHVVAGPRGDGVWLPASVAREIGARPGSTITVVGPGVFESVQTRVAAVYRDITPDRISDFWLPLASRILPPGPDAPPPPPFLQADVEELGGLLIGLHQSATLVFDFSPRGTFTLPEAERLSHRLTRLSADAADPATQVYGTFSSITTPLPSIVATAERTVAGTTQPIRAVSLAGGLLGLVAAGVAGTFMSRRRRGEFEMLSARGVGPVRFALRTIAEAGGPAVVGAAIGWAMAWLMVARLGPGGEMGAGAVRESLVVVAAATAAALAVLGIVTGRSVRADAAESRSALRGTVARSPWEAAVLALASASLYEILTRGTGVATGPNARAHVDLLVLLFPFLFLAGSVGLIVRGARRFLPRLKELGQGRSPSAFLAFARLDAAPRLATALVTSAALGLGVLVYAATVSASIASTADEKASLSVGADVTVVVGSPATVPGRPGFGWTPVTRVSPVVIGPGGVDADLMVIDRRTFARGALWDARLDGPAAQVLAALRQRAGRLPVVAVGGGLPSGPNLLLAGSVTPLDVVRSVPYFPGVVADRPTLVADREAVARTVPVTLTGIGHRYELWARGDPSRILPVLGRLGFPTGLATTETGERNTPAFLALRWTFGLLQALGVLAGVVAALAMVLYLQARQRSREVSFVLARRMGLRRRSHRRSILLETACMLSAAFVLGTVAAVAAAALVHGRVDPIPTLPPAPLFRVPLGVVAVTAAATAVTAAAAAWRVQAIADRANVGEVMRVV